MTKKCSSFLLALGALAFSVAVSSPAFAQSEAGQVAVLPVTAPEIQTLDLSVLTEVLLNSVRETGLVLVTIPASDSSLAKSACLDLPCLVGIGNKYGTERILSLRITPVGRFYSLSFRLANVSLAHMEAAQERRVEDPKVLSNVIARMVEDLIGNVLAETGRLVIDSVPEQSAVFVNGQTVGLSPVSLELPEGDYDIRVSRSGYGESKTRAKVVSGDTASVTLILSMPTVGLDNLREKTPTRLLLWGDLPVASNNPLFGKKIGVGGMMLYGKTYRVGINITTHSQVLDVDEAVWRDYGATKAPEGWTMAFSGVFLLAPFENSITPVIGIGVAGIQRKVTVTLASNTESWENDMEVGGLLLAGMDIPIVNRFFLELMYVNTFAGGKNPTTNDYDPIPHRIWRDSFDSLKSYSSIRLTIGMRI